MKPIVEVPANVSFLNEKSRLMWLASQAVDRDLVYLYCPDLGFDGVMTEEAAALFTEAAPQDVLISSNPIDAVSAAALFNEVYTADDVPNLKCFVRAQVP